MNERIDLWKKPAAGKYMIAGWRQWADAGAASSSLPQYLIQHTNATQIGQIKPEGFYLFQIPGTHHLLRPAIKLRDGHRQSFERRRNEFFYAGNDEQGFVIFLGEEPHQNEERYAEAIFDVVQELGVKRVASVAGVYGPMPYEQDRTISCVYSLPHMKDELARYGVQFSDYEGGVSISTYMADQAEARGIEYVGLYAFVPAYNFSTASVSVQSVAIGEDFKAWYDLMMKLKRMLNLELDLSDLEEKSQDLIAAWGDKMDQLDQTMPHLNVKEYLEKVSADFEESSISLDKIWDDVFRDLFEEDSP
jgi:proteasome assembly chaperone (PAC2) family protein